MTYTLRDSAKLPGRTVAVCSLCAYSVLSTRAGAETHVKEHVEPVSRETIRRWWKREQERAAS